MLHTISASYKMFFKNIRFILLYALPLLILSAINIYFQKLDSDNRAVLYFTNIAFFLIPLVSAATDISIYQRLFNFKKINPLSSPKIFVLYLVCQIAIGLIAVLPMFIFFYIFSFITASAFTILALASLLNIFVGFYFLARFNIILPLIILNKIPSLQKFLKYTKISYKKWLSVAVLVYFPYVIINYVFTCPYSNMLLTNLFMFVILCFNVYYVSNNSEEDKQNDNTVKTPLLVEEPKKTQIKEKAPVKKATTPKAAPKPATGKKAPGKKKAQATKTTKLKPVTA